MLKSKISKSEEKTWTSIIWILKICFLVSESWIYECWTSESTKSECWKQQLQNLKTGKTKYWQSEILKSESRKS